MKLKAKFGISPQEKLVSEGASAVEIRTKKDDESFLMRYRQKLSIMNGKYQANKQRKFGADYLITGNALTKKDNEILQKYAGVTLCTTN